MKLALVQTPPRGVWGKSGLAKHTTIESWLGGTVVSGTGVRGAADVASASPGMAPVDVMVLRYFGVFGPASVRDLQAWCGLTRLGEVVERLRSQFVVFRDEDGTELFDLPEAPRPHEDTPAPVRFLYDYDNLLLSHANRSRMAGYDTSVLGTTSNGILPNFVLIDGTVRAAWTLARDKSAATLGIRLLGAISAAQRDEVETEAAALLSYAAPGASTIDVRIAG